MSGRRAASRRDESQADLQRRLGALHVQVRQREHVAQDADAVVGDELACVLAQVEQLSPWRSNTGAGVHARAKQHGCRGTRKGEA